jgi:hypothetical protein
MFWEYLILIQERKDIRFAAQRLVAAFESELEEDSVDEFIQFQFHKLLKMELGKPVADRNP